MVIRGQTVTFSKGRDTPITLALLWHQETLIYTVSLQKPTQFGNSLRVSIRTERMLYR